MKLPGMDLYLGISGKNGGERPSPRTVFLSQVHGSKVLSDPIPGTEGDAMILSRGYGYPGLRTADCLPVFAVWPDSLGAAHAGWRGLAAGIVEKLLSAVDIPPLCLVLGPCICPECYRVGDDVRERVTAGDPGGEGCHPPGRVDLRGSALRRALQIAGGDLNVLDVRSCTLESPDLYSYREDSTSFRNLFWLAESGEGSHIHRPYHRPEYEYDPPRGD